MSLLTKSCSALDVERIGELVHTVHQYIPPFFLWNTRPRIVSCVQSAADTPMSPDEEDALRQHGLKSSALGDNCPTWLKKFAAMQVLTRSVSKE